MVNLAEKRPLILTILEKIVMKNRLTVVPPSNLDSDPRADPALWNNTWTSWDEPNPLTLSYRNMAEFKLYPASAVTLMSIIIGLFMLGVLVLLIAKYRKFVSSGIKNLDCDYEMTASTSGHVQSFTPQRLLETEPSYIVKHNEIN